jgi:dihydroorotase
LRSEEDRKALLKGIVDNTIDCITSDHNPMDIEHKKMEFDLAKNGTIGLESAFGALTLVLTVEKIIEKLTFGRTLFNGETASENLILQEGNKANMTLFTSEVNWNFTSQNILSKSKNSAFLNYKMKGKVYGVINSGKIILS